MTHNEDVRDVILQTIADPTIAAALLVVGWLGIVSEFLSPGKVLPGVLGVVFAILGLWSLVPEHSGLAAMVAAPLALLTMALLRVARRARRNKASLR